MTFDALTMHAVRDEIEREALGGHVDAAFLVDDRRVALEIFNGRRVFLAIYVGPSDSRVYLSTERIRSRTDSVTPFLLLLRKYVRGSRLASIEQPRLERLFCMRFGSRGAGGLPREVALYVEAMGRRSNLVLVDEDGTIMDALYRAPPSANPTRPVLPHLRYQLPPTPSKGNPEEPGLIATLDRLGSQHRGPAASLLVSRVYGLSPLAAREALVRSGQDPNVGATSVSEWTAVVAAIRELTDLVDSGNWQPSIAWQDESPIAFAPYRLRQFTEDMVRDYGTISEVVSIAGGPQVRSAPLQRLKRPILEALEGKLEASRRKRSSLERSLAGADRAEELRASGEAILSSLHRLEARAASLEWNGTRIDLYPSLSPTENAQAYFRRYADAKGAKANVPPLLDEVNAEIDYLSEMAVHLELARTEADLGQIRRELESHGVEPVDRSKKLTRPRRRREPLPAGVFRRTSFDDAEVLVGASAKGNEHVTFKLASPDDLWFHARGAPGAHVILKSRGAQPRADRIEFAARIAAENCARHLEGRVEVDYTQRKYLRKIPGAAPGRVTYQQELTLAVDLALR